MSRNNLVVEREKLQFSMSRAFDAPRQRVWDTYTDPEVIPKWWGPKKYETTVEKMDVRVGGTWRYVQKDSEGNVWAFNGVYKEVRAPERLVSTFEFEPMAGHISVDALTLEELPDGGTKITAVTTFDSIEDLEGMLQSGMEDGAVETWDRLEKLFKEAQ